MSYETARYKGCSLQDVFTLFSLTEIFSIHRTRLEAYQSFHPSICVYLSVSLSVYLSMIIRHLFKKNVID